ncbi:unnamed protein product, partial [Brassica oleracea var. botrytis]
GDDLSHGKRHEEVIWRLLQIPKDIVCQVKAIELTNEAVACLVSKDGGKELLQMPNHGKNLYLLNEIPECFT